MARTAMAQGEMTTTMMKTARVMKAETEAAKRIDLAQSSNTHLLLVSEFASLVRSISDGVGTMWLCTLVDVMKSLTCHTQQIYASSLIITPTPSSLPAIGQLIDTPIS